MLNGVSGPDTSQLSLYRILITCKPNIVPVLPYVFNATVRYTNFVKWKHWKLANGHTVHPYNRDSLHDDRTNREN